MILSRKHLYRVPSDKPLKDIISGPLASQQNYCIQQATVRRHSECLYRQITTTMQPKEGIAILRFVLRWYILFYSYSILFYSILFYSILFYSILFAFYSMLILFYSILFYSMLILFRLHDIPSPPSPSFDLSLYRDTICSALVKYGWSNGNVLSKSILPTLLSWPNRGRSLALWNITLKPIPSIPLFLSWPMYAGKRPGKLRPESTELMGFIINPAEEEEVLGIWGINPSSDRYIDRDRDCHDPSQREL